MKKALLVLLFFVLNVSAGWRDSVVLNWNGWLDTASITDTLIDGTKSYTRVFPLADGSDVRVICLVDDTAEAGFADDSVNFEWGYQSGSLCLDSGETIDTCWDIPCVIDTCDAGNYSTLTVSTMSVTGEISRTLQTVDTLLIDGYAMQSRAPDIMNEWDMLIRFWVNSLGDPSKDGAALDIRFQFIQKQYLFFKKR
jgi:hypothetical protein